MDNKPRILLVDDETDYVDTISDWLRSKGYDVLASHNGTEALALIKAQSIDIVFLDLRMPKSDGIQTLKQIRAINKELPVILVTAYAEDPAIIEANDLGISGIFPKEGGLDRLTQTLEVAIRTVKPKKS